ncbi:TetR family transcriptional regulator OS=Rhizobacter sp. Root404 OX=1736528 GN=ASC76_07500 PE=4 SV=1 [Rhizobacter fulvus]
MLVIFASSFIAMTSEPSRKQRTHDRIVDVAATAVRRDGYAGVGVADIMKQAGLTHGGFYAHFDSRDHLLAEAIERAGARSMERMRKVTERAGPDEALSAFVDAYLSDAHVDAPEEGCTLAALGTETPRQAPEVRNVCARRLKDMVDLVERQLPAWGEPGQHDKALAILSCMVGAMVLARASGDKRVSEDVRRAAKALIQRAAD